MRFWTSAESRSALEQSRGGARARRAGRGATRISRTPLRKLSSERVAGDRSSGTPQGRERLVPAAEHVRADRSSRERRTTRPVPEPRRRARASPSARYLERLLVPVAPEAEVGEVEVGRDSRPVSRSCSSAIASACLRSAIASSGRSGVRERACLRAERAGERLREPSDSASSIASSALGARSCRLADEEVALARRAARSATPRPGSSPRACANAASIRARPRSDVARARTRSREPSGDAGSSVRRRPRPRRARSTRRAVALPSAQSAVLMRPCQPARSRRARPFRRARPSSSRRLLEVTQCLPRGAERLPRARRPRERAPVPSP